jgi:mono/diheme cytochrome c family protein
MNRLAHHGFLFSLAALLAASVLPAAAQDGDVAKGRQVAQKHCSRCHVVGDFNPTGGIASTPSFQMLVKRRPDYKERFRTFFARRPHPAFLTVKGVGRPMEHLPANAAPVEITQEDVANVAAFVETLKPKPTQAKGPVVFSPRPKPRTR